MYPCSSCGRILASQQNLNYHLSHKPNTCEKYLRKLANQQKKAAMETLSSPKPSSQVAPATQTTVASLSLAAKSAPAAVSLSSAAKSTVSNVTPLASLASQKCPEPRKLLAGESVHRTEYDTDGYCWYAETGSSKRGRFYESCRCCSMYHSSDPSNVVAHIRTSKEMKCKCVLSMHPANARTGRNLPCS